MKEIAGPELDGVEARVDAWRDSIARPDWGHEQAAWNLLSVVEDTLRLRLFSVKSGRMEPGQYIVLIDHYKYILKYALNHIARLPSRALLERSYLEAEEWGLAEELLKAHQGYDHAVAAFSGARAGSLRCFLEDDGRYWFRNGLSFERLANDTLEARTAVPDVTPLVLLFRFLFEDDDDLPPALARCVKHVRSMSHEVQPDIGDDVLDELDGILGNRRAVIPQAWSTSVGNAAQISRAFRNLWLYGVAHVIAVTNAAVGESDRETPSGLNVRWLLGELTADRMLQLLTRPGSLSVEGATEFLGLLTYGRDTRSPDPALQFLFPLRPGLIAVPWFFVATCNAERNLLVLMARIRKREFDAASAAFEGAMVHDVRSAIVRRNWAARVNTHLPGQRDAGEVDVLVMDREEPFGAVVELKWSLEPSEVGEVAERERAGAEKGEQARTKCTAALSAASEIASTEGLAMTNGWTIAPLAVFDGYLPRPAGKDVSFVSHRAFLSGIAKFDRVAAAADWLQSDEWLPKAGVHFEISPTEMDVGGVRIVVDGIEPTADGEDFISARDEVILREWGVG